MATILIVDDHSVNREFLTTLLGYGNHRLLEAADGVSALRIARETRPDLVISDILMPAGDGYELVRSLREDASLGDVPVIFYTAHYNGREALHLAEACGVRTVLTKPADPARVLEVVEEVLRDAAPVRTPIADTDAFDRSHLRLVSQKLLQTTDELEWTTSRLMALIDMSLQLSSERDPRQLVSEFCRWTRELVAARSVVVGIWSQLQPNDACVAASGFPPAVSAAIERELGLHAHYPTPLSAQEAAVRISGPMKDASVLGLPAAHPPVASAMVAPVGSPSRRFGWICAANRVGRTEFSEDDERLLVLFASYVGRIFENHCLVEEGAARSRILEREVARRAEAQWRVDIQYAVARALSETSSIEIAARELLEAICTRSSFEFGELWEVDPDATQLRQVAVWHDDLAAAQRFEHLSREYVFARGVGMPGKVWETGQPVWIGDAQYDPLFLRAPRAREFGIRAAVAFPVMTRGEVIGVLGFFGGDVRQPDPELTSLFTALGSQVGQFLKRRQQEDKILRLARIQAVLGSISALIVRTGDRVALLEGACRIAVREGGFSRAAIIAGAGTSQNRLLAVCERQDGTAGAPGVPEDVPSLVEMVFHTRVAALDNDFQTPGTNFRSVVVLPLLQAGEPIAVLVLYAGSSAFFTSDEMALLEGLAAELSFALDTVSNRDQLLWMAHFDPLTGLPNRVLFHERLSQALRVAEEEEKTLVVIAGNIRSMGVVNATLGRSAGDEVLRDVARRLKKVTRYPDHLARISGDGFATFLPEVHAPAEPALRINAALDAGFHEPMMIAGQQVALAMQCGVAVFPEDGSSGEVLLANAETALRRIRGSSQRVSFFEPRMQEQVARRMALEARLARALAAEEFILHYQPKLALGTGRLVGFEALIRWREADGRLVPPNDFIPLLEESGMIVEVGRWVIRTSLADHRRWQQQGLHPPPVAVNVSVVQMREEDFVDDVLGILKGAAGDGAPDAAAALEVEITESAAMENIQRTVGQVQMLRDLGVGVSIDDFGTGHSSLGYLAQLPVSALKIDRSFVSTMAEKAESASIVAAIVSLAHSLKLEVIAEGVETQAQAEQLGALGCDVMQGYLVSRPIDSDAAAGFMQARPIAHA
jgi:diguanylate cyclase (GGDEF)-like protein